MQGNVKVGVLRKLKYYDERLYPTFTPGPVSFRDIEPSELEECERAFNNNG